MRHFIFACLRGEELQKEEETETVDAITQYDMGNEEEHGLETKEAWKLPQKKRSKEAYVLMLMVIGKFQFSEALILHI